MQTFADLHLSNSCLQCSICVFFFFVLFIHLCRKQNSEEKNIKRKTDFNSIPIVCFRRRSFCTYFPLESVFGEEGKVCVIKSRISLKVEKLLLLMGPPEGKILEVI